MNRKFVVVDNDSNLSWDGKAEAAEFFTSFAQAKKRAEAGAATTPGEEWDVYEIVATVEVPTGDPVTTLYPRKR